LDPPAYFNGVGREVISDLTIIPVTQIIKALRLRNSISVDERSAFTAPHGAAKSFVDVVNTWAARPERERETSASFTDAKGRIAKITLNCSEASYTTS
jgi:hypothetical protein